MQSVEFLLLLFSFTSNKFNQESIAKTSKRGPKEGKKARE